MNKKGQMWYLDLAVSLVIFAVAMVILAKSLISLGDSKTPVVNFLADEAVDASIQLMAEGVPFNWTKNDVVIPGILDEVQGIDIQKLILLDEIYNNTPTKFKSLLSTEKNVFVVLRNVSDGILFDTGFPLTSPKHVVQVERIGRINATPVHLQVIMWSP